MDEHLTPGAANSETIQPFSIEERVGRLEDQVWELRSKINKLSYPSKTSHYPSPLIRPTGFAPVMLFLAKVGGWLGIWIMALLRPFRSWSWLRRGLVLVLGGAILLSNWWLPLSGIWFLGNLLERLVILLLAGVWWFLIMGGKISPPWNNPIQQKGSRFFRWFSSRAS